MKILQVGMGNNPGGVEAFVMNYYRELSAKGVQFDFVCMYGRIAYAEEIAELGGHVYEIPNVKKNYFGYVREFREILRRGGYDVVHVNMLSAANIVPLRLAYQAGVRKVIAHSHNASAPGLIRNLISMWNKPKIKKYANVKAACGQAAAEWLFGKEAVLNGEVAMIQNAIHVERYAFSRESRERIREAFGWESKTVVGHVGRFEYQKNHKKVIDIFYEVAKTNPDAVLCLVGEGELLEEIKTAAKQYGISDKVIFTGVRTDVAELFSAMDVFLFPSWFEGLPFTLVEAQANGLPCVISDTITEEVMASDEVVRLPLELDAAGWAEHILKYRQREACDRNKNNQRLTQRHFNIKTEADRLLRLYQR